MDHSAVVRKKCILKVNIYCKECEGKVNRALRKVDGVYSVGLDGDTGMATVTGNMDPFKLIKALKKKGKLAEILQYQDALPEQPVPLPPPAPPVDNQNQPSVKASQQPSVQETDQHHVAQMAHLHHLSNMEKMKQVELTHSKSLRMTFKDPGNGSSQNTCIVTEDVCGPQSHQNGGASGGVAASCSVASDSGQRPAMNINTQKYSCREVGGPSREASGTPQGSCYGGISRPSCCSVPPAPLPQRNHHIQEAPNPMAHPYHDVFANDHPGGCSFM